MVKVKKYLDIDVLEASKKRIEVIFDLHDSVAVAFSGGKDSLVALHLTIDEARKRGRLPVPVIFRDEELIPDPVLKFVREWRECPDIDLRWWAVPMHSQKFIMGQSHVLTLWDTTRDWLREKPSYALGQDVTEVMDQYDMDELTTADLKGRVAVINGIRADESLIRLRASMNKLNLNYINATASKRVFLCKPVFDWSERDVFKFFMERGVPYCELYDSQHLSGMSLRVSTPLHAETAKRFDRIRSVSPTFYQQLVDLFPEMLVQERYFRDLDTKAIEEKYGHSIVTIREYIIENIIDEEALALALKRLDGVSLRYARTPWAYPLRHILKYFKGGAFKREMLPVSKGTT